MNNIRFVVWLCVCILIATGGAFGASVVPPNAVDIVDVVYDPNPVPGTIQEMMITLNINTPCTIALTTKCFGELELVNSFDGIKVFGANTGQPVTKSIPISFMGGTESSRVALSVHASGYNGVFGADTQTMITIVPEMGAATTGYDVGVFFDQAGTVSCLPDSTSFPCMVTAYLLLARYGEMSGVVGWEGELSCDAGLYPIQGSLAGTGLNLASFPAYIVGLSEPLGPDSTILLATFLVYATNPGGIYFRGLGVNGIDAYPAFVAEGGERTPLGYIYGGTDSPVASVGEPVCPGLSDMARYRSSVFPAYGSKSAPMREPQVQVIERGPRVDGKSATLTYTVSVSGDITFGNSFSADRQGVYGSRVSLMFRNRSNGNGWHPSINSAEHVTYDLLDEGGHYDFGFSFSASQSWVESYDQIRILVSPVNSGCKIPADDTGYRVWDFDVAGYVDYLNEVDGVEIEFDASVATISYVADNTVFNWALGGTLRNMKLSHELVSALYEGAVPYSLPPVAARVEDLGSGWGGVYQSCGSENAITIDPDWSVSWIVDHEYGHYLNHRAWGGNCSGQWTDHTADNFIEGFGIFFSFAARSYSQSSYQNEVRWNAEFTDLVEGPPFQTSPRYNGIAYADIGYPEYAAAACFFWNLYDGYEDNGLEAYPYASGDNDDVSGFHRRVFETLRTMTTYQPALHVQTFLSTFKNGLSSEDQASVDAVYDFMYEDLVAFPTNVAMRSPQVAGVAIDTPNTGTAVIAWWDNNYGPAYYRNVPSGYRVYREDGGWTLIGDLPWNARELVYHDDDVGGLYKVTAYNIVAGESGRALEVPVGLSAVPSTGESIARIVSTSPNPFNPSTLISYHVPTRSQVNLDVYDLQGKRVVALINEYLDPGDYSVRWTGEDKDGRAAASGIYLVKVGAGGASDFSKITLLK